MTALILELPPEDFARLEREAERRGTSATALAQELLAEQLSSEPPDPDQKKRDILAAMENLDELRADMRRRGVAPVDAVDLVRRGQEELDLRIGIPEARTNPGERRARGLPKTQE